MNEWNLSVHTHFNSYHPPCFTKGLVTFLEPIHQRLCFMENSKETVNKLKSKPYLESTRVWWAKSSQKETLYEDIKKASLLKGFNFQSLSRSKHVKCHLKHVYNYQFFSGKLPRTPLPEQISALFKDDRYLCSLSSMRK